MPGTWSPRPIDLIEFDSVRWDDGTYTGKPPFPHADALIEGQSGQRLQLRRIVEVLRRTLAGPDSGLELLASARTGIDALADAEPDQLDAAKLAMQSIKAVVQADIARFERDQSSHSIERREDLADLATCALRSVVEASIAALGLRHTSLRSLLPQDDAAARRVEHDPGGRQGTR